MENASSPKNTTELKAYSGLLTYNGRFLPNLYRLLRKDARWRWSAREKAAFKASKQLLTSAKVLAYYNPELELVVTGDASSYGLGAVLSRKLATGEERPIQFASRSLSPAERNYSQLDKEALACIFAVKRFHSFIYGRHFMLQTDHKPLLTLLGERKATSPQASARMQRWSLTLATYDYSIVFKPTESHSNADGLSRLPLPDAPSEVPFPAELVLLVEFLLDGPVKAHEIRSWTRTDPALSQVSEYIQSE